jgi:hypothetical protein
MAKKRKTKATAPKKPKRKTIRPGLKKLSALVGKVHPAVIREVVEEGLSLRLVARLRRTTEDWGDMSDEDTLRRYAKMADEKEISRVLNVIEKAQALHKAEIAKKYDKLSALMVKVPNKVIEKLAENLSWKLDAFGRRRRNWRELSDYDRLYRYVPTADDDEISDALTAMEEAQAEYKDEKQQAGEERARRKRNRQSMLNIEQKRRAEEVVARMRELDRKK